MTPEERQPALKKSRSRALGAVVGDEREDPAREAPATPAPFTASEAGIVQRKRKEKLYPFATRIRQTLHEEIKEHCEATDQLITDFIDSACVRELDRQRRELGR